MVELEKIEKSLSNLLDWFVEIQDKPLDELKAAPVFRCNIHWIDLIAHELHLLQIMGKKREGKFEFLSKFFDSFSTIRGIEDIISNVFNLLYLHIDNSDAVLFLKDQEGYTPSSDSFYSFLNEPLDEKFEELLFPELGNEIRIFNNVTEDNIIYPFFFKDELDFSEGQHFMFVRVEGQPYIMCFYRMFGCVEFSDFETEFILETIGKIKLLINNLERFQVEARMAGELETAAALQQSLFPKKLPQYNYIEISTFFESASETGGDWYGFIELNDNLCTLIGDVTGHGTPAALVTASANATCKMIQRLHEKENALFTPSDILSHLNYAVYETGAPNYLMTFLALIIDPKTNTLTFSNAGHNFPLLIRNKKIKPLLNRNLRLGDHMEHAFTQTSFQLEPGDIIFLFTDGLLENENTQGDMWGEHHLRQCLRKYHDRSIEELVEQIIEEAYNFYENVPLQDDLTVVALKYHGA